MSGPVFYKSGVAARLGEWLYKLSAALFFLATLLLVWRRNKIIDFGVYIPTIKPSDILILLAFLAAAGAWLFSKKIRNNPERNRFIFKWGKYILGFIGFLILGSLWSFFILGAALAKEFFLEWLREGISIAAFFLVLFLGYGKDRYLHSLIFAFLSSLILIPLLFLPEREILESLLVVSPASYTLLAFHSSTIALASFLIIPLLLLFSLYFLEKSWKKYLFGIITGLLTAILIWTGSRAGWLAVFLGMITVVILKAVKEEKPKKIFFRGIMAVVLIFAFGFLVLSRPARNTALIRVFPRLKVDISLKDKVIRKTPTGDFIKLLESFPLFGVPQLNMPVVDIGFSGDRGEFWLKYSIRALSNPLGVGPQYIASFNEKNGSGQSVNAHSLWLQIALSAGLGGLAVFLIMLYGIGIKLIELVKNKNDVITYALAGAFVGILVNSTFIDALTFRWLWIILALIIVKYQNRISVPEIQ